jgi:hypothetical protein
VRAALALTLMSALQKSAQPCGELGENHAPIVAFELARSEADLLLAMDRLNRGSEIERSITLVDRRLSCSRITGIFGVCAVQILCGSSKIRGRGFDTNSSGGYFTKPVDPLCAEGPVMLHSESAPRLGKRLLLAALLAITCAPAAYAKKIMPVTEPKPELVATHGFVVGTLAGGNGKTAENFSPPFQVLIDDESLSTDRTFMVAVTPGTHVLRQVKATIQTADNYVGRKEFLTSTYTLNRQFTVEAGKVTILGALYLYEKDMPPADLSDADTTGAFIVLAADNGAFVTEFIERKYPEIYAKLADKALHPASAFLNDNQYKALHRVMARVKLRDNLKGKARLQPNMRYLVYGDLGMAGHLYTDKSGALSRFDSFELDTFETVQSCDVDDKRHVCLTMTQWSWSGYERRAFAGSQGSKAQRLALPDGASPIGAHLFGSDGMILGDYNYRLYARASAQEPWQAFEQKGVKAGAFVARYNFGDAAEGVYTYYEGNEHALTFTNLADAATRALPLPPKFKGGAKVLVTPQHLVIGPEWNLFSASEVYRRRHENGEWAMSKLPKGRCDWMGLDSNKRLLVACGASPGTTYYVSLDDGATWSPEGE